MSGSNKKQTKAASAEEAMKQQRSQRKEAEEKKQQTLYTVIGSIVAVIVAGLVFWNQGFYQRSVAAFTIDGTKYTAAQVQLYYSDLLYNALMGSYTPEEGGVAYDFQVSATEQAYSNNATWHDFFTEEACRTLADLHVIAQTAKDSGFVLPPEANEQLEMTKNNLDTVWVGYSSSKSAFLRSQYNMTEAEYLAMAEMEVYANYFQEFMYDQFEYSSSELEAYYEDNKASLDAITYSQLQFVVEDNTSYDEEGNAIEKTEEEVQIYEGLKMLVEAEAQEALEALVAGDDFAHVAEEYSTYLQTSVEHHVVLTSSLTGTDNASAWILGEDREFGDKVKTEDTVSGNVYYSVTIFESRDRAEEKISDIRHILIPANTEDNYVPPTEEQWDESEETAQDLLDLWVSDGADPEKFSELAIEHSVDSSSATNGGVMTSVSPYDGFADEFAEWISDPSREAGDYGLVKNTQSSIQGWHLMYFDEWGLPLWEENATITMSNENMTQWLEDTTEGVHDRITFGKGKAYVKTASLF